MFHLVMILHFWSGDIHMETSIRIFVCSISEWENNDQMETILQYLKRKLEFTRILEF